MLECTEDIYVGSYDDAFFDVEILSNVTHILNVAKEINVSDRVNHIYKKIAIEDDDIHEDIRVIFNESIEFIDDALSNNGKVLIHCWEGKSRSVCVCIAYLCLRYKMTLANALTLVRTRRPEIDIFPLYFEQLSLYIGC